MSDKFIKEIHPAYWLMEQIRASLKLVSIVRRLDVILLAIIV
jgi:hypothetical protein